MASSIDASTSGAGGVITTADNTGILQLKSGGTTIATVSSTGLALNAGNITLPSTAAPTFRAYQNSAQNISTAVITKVTFDTENWDTNNNFASSTFTPTVAGYYQVSGCIAFNATSGINSNTLCTIYKNGSRFKDGNLSGAGSAGTLFYSVVSALVYLNGSTDYVELWGLLGGTGTLTFSVNSGTNSYFQAVMIRGA